MKLFKEVPNLSKIYTFLLHSLVVAIVSVFSYQLLFEDTASGAETIRWEYGHIARTASLRGWESGVEGTWAKGENWQDLYKEMGGTVTGPITATVNELDVFNLLGAQGWEFIEWTDGDEVGDRLFALFKRRK